MCVCAFLCMYLQEASKLNSVLCQTFVFCYLWALGGNLIDSHWDTFDTFVRQQFEDNSDAKVHFKYTEIHLRSFWLSMIKFIIIIIIIIYYNYKKTPLCVTRFGGTCLVLHRSAAIIFFIILHNPKGNDFFFLLLSHYNVFSVTIQLLSYSCLIADVEHWSHCKPPLGFDPEESTLTWLRGHRKL